MNHPPGKIKYFFTGHFFHFREIFHFFLLILPLYLKKHHIWWSPIYPSWHLSQFFVKIFSNFV